MGPERFLRSAPNIRKAQSGLMGWGAKPPACAKYGWRHSETTYIRGRKRRIMLLQDNTRLSIAKTRQQRSHYSKSRCLRMSFKQMIERSMLIAIRVSGVSHENVSHTPL